MGRAASAFTAGLRPGDVIRTFNGVTITDTGHSVADDLRTATVGCTATLGVLREGTSVTVRVPIERPRAGSSADWPRLQTSSHATTRRS